MNPGDVSQALVFLRDNFVSILEPDAIQIISALNTQVRLAMRASRGTQRGGGYTIQRDKPLRFIAADVNGYKLRPDIHCHVRWDGAGQPPSSRNLVIRIWSNQQGVMWREQLDAPDLREDLHEALGRVMLRFHFDQHDSPTDGVVELTHPIHHMQVGGVAGDDELCWLHQSITVPRFPYPPLDLILACELVCVNFFPDEYERIRVHDIWKGAINASEQSLLRPYYEACHRHLSMRLPGSLWERHCAP